MTMPNPKSEVRNPKAEKPNSPISDFPRLWQTPGLSHYYVVCLVSLCVIWLVLLRRELPATVTLFPVLVGILGIAVRWRLGPVFLLATFAIGLKIEFTSEGHRAFRGSDMILCAAA